MARKNINPLDVLKQVQKEVNAGLSDLESLNQTQILESDFNDNPEFLEILKEIGKQNSEISQHLSEINERINS